MKSNPLFIFVAILAIYSGIFCHEKILKELPSIVRVLIASIDESCESKNIEIEHSETLYIKDLEGNCKQHITSPDEKKTIISWHKNGIKINGRPLRTKHISLSSAKPIKYQGNYYPPDFKVYFDTEKKRLFFTNNVDLEEYVAWVIACESYRVWPKESHKVSAIVCRTFAVHKILHAKNKPYDLKADVADQVYKGIQDHTLIQEATLETKGQLLMCNGVPITAMYHICCGGVIPIDCSGINFKKFPYLARNYACTTCASYSYYSWDISFNSKEACERLSTFLNKEVLRIKELKITRYAKTGTVKRAQFVIVFKDGKKKKTETITFDTKQLQKIFSISMQNRSACFKITFKSNVTIKGRGVGHHFGLCQRGAKGLIDKGKTYKEVLSFYYPKTYIETYENFSKKVNDDTL